MAGHANRKLVGHDLVAGLLVDVVRGVEGGVVEARHASLAIQ